MSASEWNPRTRASRSNVSLTKGSTRSPSAPFTRCSKASANTGSMPDEHPASIEMVPVGAMAVTVAFRIGRPVRYIERLQFGKGPRSSARRQDWSCAFSLTKAMRRSARSSAAWLS